jgi:hypothetical protein
MQALDYWNERIRKDINMIRFTQKRTGLGYRPLARRYVGQDPDLPATKEGIAIAASIALWGNKMDLSLYSRCGTPIRMSFPTEAAEANLCTTMRMLWRRTGTLRRAGGGQDIIVDNAGFRADYRSAPRATLDSIRYCETVTFQLKSHPTLFLTHFEKDLL